MIRGLWASIAALLIAGVIGVTTVEGHDGGRPVLATGGDTPTTARQANLPDDLLTPLTTLAPTLPTVTTPPVSVPKVPVTVPSVPVTVPPVVSALHDVFYVQPFGQHTTLVAYNWAGVKVREIALDQDAECCGMAISAPNGAYFALGFDAYKGDGTRLRYLPWNLWSDDNDHVCRINPAQVPAKIGDTDALDFVSASTGESRRIATLPNYGPETFPMVAACNPSMDRAVVLERNFPERSGVVIKLSTGATTPIPAACSHPYSVSGDGKIVASADNADYHEGPMTLCDITTGAVIGHSPILGGLNGDGSVLQTTRMDDCDWYHDTILWDWRKSKVVWSSDESDDGKWRLDCQHIWGGWRHHEAGSEIALQASIVNAGRDPGDVIIVNPGHSTKRVATNITYSQVF